MGRLALRCTFEGCSEGPSRSSITEDEPWDILQELLSGSMLRRCGNAIAVADGERGGEVRYIGEVDTSDESMRRAVNQAVGQEVQPAR